MQESELRHYVDCSTSAAEAIHIRGDGACHHLAYPCCAAAHAGRHFPGHQHPGHLFGVDLQRPATSGDGATHHLQRRTRRNHAGERRRAHRITIAQRNCRHQSFLSTRRQHSDVVGANRRHLANLFALSATGNHTAPGHYLFGIDRAGHPDRLDQRHAQRAAAFRFRQLFYPHATCDCAGRCHAISLRRQAARR